MPIRIIRITTTVVTSIIVKPCLCRFTTLLMLCVIDLLYQHVYVLPIGLKNGIITNVACNKYHVVLGLGQVVRHRVLVP